MRRKPLFWCLAGVFCAGVAVCLWRSAAPSSSRPPVEARLSTNSPAASASVVAQSQTAVAGTSPAAISKVVTNGAARRVAAAALDPKKLFPYRLSNTDEAYDRLVHNERGILLMNAALDTGRALNLSIPDSLQAPADNGSYIVQAHGALDDSHAAAERGS